MNLGTLLGLLLFGGGVLAFGVYMWLHAAAIVADARLTLQQMFGETHPSLFADEPDPRVARIAGVAMIVLGLGLLSGAVVVLIVQ